MEDLENMLNPQLASKIREALLRLDYKVDEITADQRFDDLGIDSVSLSELLALLEDDYDIDVDSEELFSIETFGELSRLLEPR